MAKPDYQQLADVPHHVLVVDDNQINRDVIAAMLEFTTTPIEAVYADSGEAALEHIQHTAFGCILLDIHMPGMNGFDTLAAIRQKETTLGRAPAPVIAVTADAASLKRPAQHEHRFTDVLQKPFELNQLLTTIQTSLAETSPDES